MKTILRLRHLVRGSSGQALLEFALLAPLLFTLALGVAEFGNLLHNQHVVVKLTREGSNLISRDTPIGEATAALAAMSGHPVNFNTRSKVIFSVLKKGSTTGTANYNRIFLYQRHEFGTLAATSKVSTNGGGGFQGPPDYIAVNSDNSAGLQVTSEPADLIAAPGGMIYITEIFTEYEPLTPLSQFGIGIPTTLYSIAYF
jgi:hypothetical protein